MNENEALIELINIVIVITRAAQSERDVNQVINPNTRRAMRTTQCSFVLIKAEWYSMHFIFIGPIIIYPSKKIKFVTHFTDNCTYKTDFHTVLLKLQYTPHHIMKHSPVIFKVLNTQFHSNTLLHSVCEKAFLQIGGTMSSFLRYAWISGGRMLGFTKGYPFST
mgnify:CR=1 FL=1